MLYHKKNFRPLRYEFAQTYNIYAMQYRKLGNSDLMISEIGFGCMSLKPPVENIQSLIERAIEHGINFFDTADLYDKGANESWLGKALGARRKEVMIASKVGNQWRPDGSGWDWNPRAAYIRKAIDESLRRLNTDYIDLYQLHGGTMEDDMEEIVDCFESLQAAGKIRYFGISSIRPAVIEKYALQKKISSVMMQYSLLDRRPESGSLDLLHRQGIGVLARGVLAKGLLAGKAPEAYLDHSADVVKNIQEKLKLENPQLKPSQAAVRFVLNHPAVSTAVVGFRTMEQLEDLFIR
jgi:aryl-alcohol dehydrogenase-like predicted oxidoreductase